MHEHAMHDSNESKGIELLDKQMTTSQCKAAFRNGKMTCAGFASTWSATVV